MPDHMDRIAYISTDEANRSFFEPFDRKFKAVYFLKDLQEGTGMEAINKNYVGMIEQVLGEERVSYCVTRSALVKCAYFSVVQLLLGKCVAAVRYSICQSRVIALHA